jgi:hypothetical protein
MVVASQVHGRALAAAGLCATAAVLLDRWAIAVLALVLVLVLVLVLALVLVPSPLFAPSGFK